MTRPLAIEDLASPGPALAAAVESAPAGADAPAPVSAPDPVRPGPEPGRSRRPTLAMVVAACAVAALAGVAAIVAAPAAAPVIAGCVLMVAGFAVMAPCQLEMAITISHVFARLRAGEGGEAASVLRRTVGFSAGYLLFYAPFALALGLLARALGGYAWLAVLAGAGMALALGMVALGKGPRMWLSRCRGPLYLLASGKASFRSPVKAGWTYGRYCVSCCGPYTYALIVLAGGTRSVRLGAALVLAYALLMVAPTIIVALITPKTAWRIAERAHDLAPAVESTTGLMLVGLGIVLVPVAIAAAL